jgi:hypothetical protein
VSYSLSSKDGVKARKRYRCCLCGEGIEAGELHDTRSGIQAGDGWWTMRMHPGCHAYESRKTVDPEWYEDISDPAFRRADAISAKCVACPSDSATPSASVLPPEAQLGGVQVKTQEEEKGL